MAFDVERIEQKIDRAEAATTAVSANMGGVQFRNMLEIMEAAKLLSLSGPAIPKWLQGNPGGCWAVIVQSIEWNMSSIAVARMSFEVNGVVGYMSQLIHAVVEARAPLKGRLRGKWEGEEGNRTCTVTGILKGEDEPFVYTSPPINKIKVKNSPLWQGDPDQQLWYYSTRAWARRYCPDVLMGIYSKDEIEEGLVDITPEKPGLAARLKGNKDRAGFQADNVETGTGTKQAALPKPTEEPIEIKADAKKEPGKVLAEPADEIERAHQINEELQRESDNDSKGDATQAEPEASRSEETASKATGGGKPSPAAGADDAGDIPEKLKAANRKKAEPKKEPAEEKPAGNGAVLQALLDEMAEAAKDINTMSEWQSSASVKKRALALSDADRVKFVEAREKVWEKL